MTKVIALTCAMLCIEVMIAQTKQKIDWLSFDQLDDSLSESPKNTLLYFYTDWCSYCKKMEQKAFSHPDVMEALQDNYYAVKFDAESEDTIYFEGKAYVNDEIGKSRRPLHQLSLILACRDSLFVAPTIILLDPSFRVKHRSFKYLTSREIISLLKKNNQLNSQGSTSE